MSHKQIRKLILIFALIVIVCSCEEKIIKSDIEIITEKENAEVATGLKNDTIILGFYFGMTESQVLEKFLDLSISKKVYLNNETQFQYDFFFNYPKKATASFASEYFQEKLYKMTLILVSEEVSTAMKLLQLKLIELFNDKYGFFFIKKESLLRIRNDDFDVIWINGNRKIEIIEGYSDVRIVYTNIIDEREFKRVSEEKEKLKIEEVIKDI